MKYRDNMTAEELSQFRREIDELDAAYTQAAEHDKQNEQPIPEGWEDEMAILYNAALNRGRP